ncbi:MAG TPA: HAD-IA family hydrolase [Myxococcota bacterium]
MKALILDFDGVILDTETTDFESWNAVYREHGVRLPRDEWVQAIGSDGKAFDPVARLSALTGRPLEAAALREARRRVREGMLLRLEPLPGVVAWIEHALGRGMQLAIASSSPLSWVEGHLERAGLRRHFAELVTSEQVPRVKPDPALYLRTLSILDVAPSEALAVEDSPHGVAAARAASLKCVAVPGPMTRGCDFRQADLRLDSLSERSLEDVLRDLFA